MRYNNITEGIFVSRPNRFIAVVDVNGVEDMVHVKNTGRCKELLVPGCRVYLERSANPNRKTKYDLISVLKETESGPMLINMDSQIPNDVAEEWLRAGNFVSEDAVIRREVTHGDSRFDFYIEDGSRKIFLEVKGVTLEENGVCRFPDAPTERGVKHLNGLVKCIQEGYEATILFIIQMKGVNCFMPNDETHPEFGSALRAAVKAGVKVMAVDCIVDRESIRVENMISVLL